MSKRLILIRHAKSSWDAPLDDHARTLNERGRQGADAIGAWLAANAYVPDAIYSSDAARTFETTQRVVAALGTDPTIEYISGMYHGAPATLWNVLRKAQGDSVALIAHNPGIAFFAEDVVSRAPDHPRFMDYPTCATLVCDFAINDWAEAVPRSGQVIDFITPREITG